MGLACLGPVRLTVPGRSDVSDAREEAVAGGSRTGMFGTMMLATIAMMMMMMMMMAAAA